MLPISASLCSSPCRFAISDETLNWVLLCFRSDHPFPLFGSAAPCRWCLSNLFSRRNSRYWGLLSVTSSSTIHLLSLCSMQSVVSVTSITDPVFPLRNVKEFPSLRATSSSSVSISDRASPLRSILAICNWNHLPLVLPRLPILYHLLTCLTISEIFMIQDWWEVAVIDSYPVYDDPHEVGCRPANFFDPSVLVQHCDYCSPFCILKPEVAI